VVLGSASGLHDGRTSAAFVQNRIQQGAICCQRQSPSATSGYRSPSSASEEVTAAELALTAAYACSTLLLISRSAHA
jgi:hypothetical protein